MRRPLPGFAALDPPEGGWPLTRGRFRPERLEASVETLPSVGPALKKRLAKLGLERVGDLISHRPRRYEEPAPERRIADLFGEDEVLIEGEVLKTSTRHGRGRLRILTAQIADDSGQISATWFNQPWLQEKLVPGTRVRLRGTTNRYGFLVRSYDLNGGSATADFAPVYPASEEISAAKLRELVANALAHVRDYPDPLPVNLKAERGLPLKGDALVALHAPSSLEEAEEGRRRLAFDELLVLQLALVRQAAEREQAFAAALREPGELIERYRVALPFTLTEHQEAAIAEIDADLARTTPMQRLLQGDVGSGKTVVALYALLRAVEAGRQGALMAPTETLAEQHFLTIEGICGELGVAVMCRTCGERPSASAERCSTPKRCCSSTTATARSANSTSRWIRACVPTASWASPDAILPRMAECSFAGRALVSRTHATPSSAQSPSMVRKCCSASVSVGAISAPWRPASTARRSA